jgi:hypothetical protein
MDEEQTGSPPPEEANARRDSQSGGGEEPSPSHAADGGDAEATSVLRDRPEEATRVLPAEEPTRIMHDATDEPAQPLHQPTVTMTRRPSSHRTWWWVVVALLILAAAVIAAFLLLRPDNDATAGQDYIGTWMPADRGGGGLVIKRNADAFTVTAYDSQIQPIGSGEATLIENQLRLKLPATAFDAQDSGTMTVTISHIAAQDSLHLVAQAVGATRVERDYLRTDVLQPASATVAPVPTPTPTPSATPSPTTSGSPSTTADQQITAGLAQIRGGVTAWAAATNGVYPAATEVTSTGGVAQYVSPWPVNPVTGQPMAAGTAPGDYTYEQLDGGQHYRLTGYLSNGDLVTYDNLP